MDVSNFISPKELLKIKREIVEQALAQANPIVAMEYVDGILLMAENPMESLHKVAEIYDRIGFAGTGVYNDYERLRRAGVQYADVKGFSYSRRDVKARAIATEYSNTLGDVFMRQSMPWEVEILVVELGDTQAENRMYMIPFSGGLVEEKGFCVIGDIARQKDGELRRQALRKKLVAKELTGEESLEQAVKVGYEALLSLHPDNEIETHHLEIAVLDRTMARSRKMRHLMVAEIDALLGRTK